MKNLSDYIKESIDLNEAVKVSKDSKVNKDYNETYDDVYDFVEKFIIGNTKPNEWNDTEDYDIMDTFEEYSDSFGDWDDTLRVLKPKLHDVVVVGYMDDDSYAKCLKKCPPVVSEIMKNCKKENIYHKGSYSVDMWECDDYQFHIDLYQFRIIKNNSGTEIPYYCYYMGIENN